MKLFKQVIATVIFSSVIAAGCKKPIDNPQPEEQELITTLRLIVTNDSGFNKVFDYKVDNGFGGSVQGSVKVDDIVLSPDTKYNVEVNVLDESKNPVDDITEEVISESHHHLFIFESEPVTGAGSVVVSDGCKDDEGHPFNQKVTFTTGSAGTGKLTVTLKHEPTNKNAATADEAGGETDALAPFPVKIQ